MKLIRTLLVPLLLVVLVTAGLRFIRSGPTAAPDYPAGIAGAEVLITVTNGESGSDIAKSLFDSGVVKSIDAFLEWLWEISEPPESHLVIIYWSGIFRQKLRLPNCSITKELLV